MGSYIIGDTTRDSLASGDCTQTDGTYIDFFDFTADAQLDLRISLSSPTNPAILQLFDQRGAVIANSYVQGTSDTSATLRVMLGTGTYGIGVRGVNRGAKGAYRLVAANDTSAVAGCGFVWVTPGITTTQRILNADCNQGPGGSSYLYHVYTIVLLQNQTLDVTEHSTAFSPQMVLVGQTGSTYSTVDSTGTNARMSFVTSAQGAFQLWVGGSAPTALGQYSVTIR